MKSNLKKKIIFIPSVLLLSSLFTTNITEAAITNKPGDIIVTQSTDPSMKEKGLFGHTGIYISSTTILHISGPGAYPKPIDESQWHRSYSSSKVIRPNSSTLGSKAAANAKKYFTYVNAKGKRVGKKIPYFISPGPTNISKTYCSELVWYSYYKSGKTFYNANDNLGPFWDNTIKPYTFVKPLAVKYNGFKFIDNKW